MSAKADHTQLIGSKHMKNYGGKTYRDMTAEELAALERELAAAKILLGLEE